MASYSVLNHVSKPVKRPRASESLSVLVKNADFWALIQTSKSESLAFRDQIFGF